MNTRLYIFIIIAFALIGASLFLFNKEPPEKQSNIQKPQTQVGNVKGEKTEESTSTAELSTKSSREIYLGIWTQGFFDSKSNQLNVQTLKSLETQIGKRFAIAHYYLGWEWLSSKTLLTQLNEISSNGWRPMLSVNPYFFGACPANGLPLYRAIANGNCDNFLKNSANNLKSFGKPLFLRFAWEMNIPSMGWEIAKTQSTNSDFISAWRKIHDIFYSQGATNVLFVFSPDSSQTGYNQIYPGDKYVDWIALDGYNWGTTQTWSKWQTFTQIFQNAYNQITTAAPNKPLMIAETNTTDKGGDKAAWYKDALENQIPNNFPKIKAVVLYNEDRTQKEGVNWKIDINQPSLNALKNAIQSKEYLSTF